MITCTAFVQCTCLESLVQACQWTMRPRLIIAESRTKSCRALLFRMACSAQLCCQLMSNHCQKKHSKHFTASPKMMGWASCIHLLVHHYLCIFKSSSSLISAISFAGWGQERFPCLGCQGEERRCPSAVPWSTCSLSSNLCRPLPLVLHCKRTSCQCLLEWDSSCLCPIRCLWCRSGICTGSILDVITWLDAYATDKVADVENRL